MMNSIQMHASVVGGGVAIPTRARKASQLGVSAFRGETISTKALSGSNRVVRTAAYTPLKIEANKGFASDVGTKVLSDKQLKAERYMYSPPPPVTGV